MTRQIIAGLLALLLGANAMAMLFAGPWWYGAVPGVTATGPFNPHFVMDIGAAYLVVAGALAWRASRPAAGQGALVAAAAFLVLHGLIHLADAAMGGHAGADLARDFPGVFLPALLAVWLAWPARPAA
jgi:hypothetical protein